MLHAFVKKGFSLQFFPFCHPSQVMIYSEHGFAECFLRVVSQ